jgi:hypothetical protein
MNASTAPAGFYPRKETAKRPTVDDLRRQDSSNPRVSDRGFDAGQFTGAASIAVEGKKVIATPVRAAVSKTRDQSAVTPGRDPHSLSRAEVPNIGRLVNCPASSTVVIVPLGIARVSWRSLAVSHHVLHTGTLVINQ